MQTSVHQWAEMQGAEVGRDGQDRKVQFNENASFCIFLYKDLETAGRLHFHPDAIES